MAKITAKHQLQLVMVSILLTWQVTSSSAEDNPSVKTKRSILDNILSNEQTGESSYQDLPNKRYSSFRSDLGKRSDLSDNEDQDAAFEDEEEEMEKRSMGYRSDLGKRQSSYRSDLGKRVGILSGVESPDDLLATIKRYGGMGFRTDLGKRSQEDTDGLEYLRDLLENEAAKRAYRSDLGKRYSSFRSDLGKRSSAFRSDLGKRQYFRADLGKRASFRADLGKRSFRTDLGKRSAFRSDLRKRSAFRSDLGKRSAFRSDLGKRSAFRSDLGKRSAFRADLGKRSIDGAEIDLE